jgi:hypothetical protein
MDVITFTPQVIAGIIAVFLALAFAYFPSLNTWYGGLKSEVKSAIMIGLLALTTATVYALALAGVIATTDPLNWWLAVKIFVAALILNQPTYSILPELGAVTAAKASRK